MAGKGVRVLTTPTSNLGKILACMHGTAAIQIAQLALKHRQNKNQRQRILVFAGSPIKYEKKALEIVGKRLKKNSVSLDIVNFGEDDDEEKKDVDQLDQLDLLKDMRLKEQDKDIKNQRLKHDNSDRAKKHEIVIDLHQIHNLECLIL